MAAARVARLRLTVGCALGLWAVAPCEADGQAGRGRGALRGVVADSSGAPIAAADVSILALHQSTHTDEKGRFTFGQLPLGELELTVRRLGYGPQSVRFVVTAGGADSTRVTMTELPDVLAGMTSAGQRTNAAIQQFYQRRARGIGTFYTRDEITERHAVSTSDVLRMAPGARVVRVADGNGIRFSTATGRRNCPPLIWLDGQKAIGMEVDQIPLSDIEGIEVYQTSSTTPTQFWQNSTTTCGTIVVWSRHASD